ncbi:beta-lactamase/transpeptidase-like protein [Gymnopus androsaceus JB14]|uniref:Beta-lactamase/transpeptidase-like protein n=1 Tax=Gymnopus androsaceus JB14 TaxID=1447944 RepID=A0A6A4HEH1_9AGAR|nr:beta-lactamase/transpeptidase-like protein [Gymnopus androsaceus JB14]
MHSAHAETQMPFAQSCKSILNPTIDSFIEHILEDWSSAGGASIAVVRKITRGDSDSDVSWNVEIKGYGIAKADGTKVDPDTLFNLGSNSKLFNAISVGLLISNESLSPRLSWETEIASVLPEWGLLDPVASTKNTVSDLMSHRTGMPRHDYIYEASENISSLITRLRHLKPSASFRDIYQYTNVMYIVLSYLPSALIPSKPTYAEYVSEYIFKPLGLNSTTFSGTTASQSGRMADGFARQPSGNPSRIPNNPFEKGTTRIIPYFNSPNGQDGNGKNPSTNQTVIPAEVIRKVATGITVSDGAASYPELSPVVYGGGQGMYSYRGHCNFLNIGFHSQIIRFPFDDFGIVILLNDDKFGTHMYEVMKWRIVDEILGLESVDWNSRLKQTYIDEVVIPRNGTLLEPKYPKPPSFTSFSDLQGVYRHPAYGSIEMCLVPLESLSTEEEYRIDSKQSQSCQELIKELPDKLPGIVTLGKPTLVVKWNKFWSSHLRFEHFNGDLFNITLFTSMVRE